MCDTDSTIPTFLQDSLNTWAVQNDCACVNVEKDVEYKRIWLFCVTSAAFVCLTITLLMVWSDRRKQEEDFHPDAEAAEAVKSDPQRRPSKRSAAEVQRELEQLAKEEDPPAGPEPDFEHAKRHLKRTSPTKDGKWRPIWGTNCAELCDVGGVGTELYFRLLKRLGITFMYMAALTSIAVTFNAHSSFAPDNGQYLAKTTIGNVGSNVVGTAVPPDQRYLVLKGDSGCEGIPVTSMTRIIAWLDWVAVVIFVASVARFRFIVVPKIALLADEENVTVKDFGIEIDLLPRKFEGMQEVDDADECKYETELKSLLEERMTAMRQAYPCPGLEAAPVKVHELVLVRDYGGRLGSYTQQAQLTQDVDIHEYCGRVKQHAKTKKKLEKLTEHLKKKLGSLEELAVVRAYAIVGTQQDAMNLWMDYRFSTYTLMRLFQWGVSRCSCLESCCPQRKRFFRNHVIRVRRAPEPSNILWENQDLPAKWRWLRWGIINLIFLIIVLLSFVLVYAANTAAKSNMKSNNQLLGDDACDPVVGNMLPGVGEAEPYKCFVQNATLWSNDYLENTATEAEIGCWCGTMGYLMIMENPKLIVGRCAGWLAGIGKGIGIGVLATLIVVAINVGAKSVLLFLAQEEKPLSESELNSSKMVKIWSLQTLNTGFVIFCVNLSPPKGLALGWIFLGEYGDSVRGWYTVVGAALLMNMLANSVVPGITSLVMMWVNKIMRCCAARKGKVKHHRELLRLYENPEFDIAAKFAQLLTTVFVTMTYSAGLPMLNFFAAGYMFFTFWCDKVSLLWGSKRPPAFDTTLALDAAQFMLYSLVLHCLFAIWMFGQPCTFPSAPVGGSLSSLSIASLSNSTLGQAGVPDSTSYATQYGFADRLTLESTWMMFILLLIAIGLWVLWTVAWILGGTVGEIFKCCFLVLCPGKKAAKVSPEDAEEPKLRRQDMWDHAKKHIQNICPPASYKLEEHPNFRHLKNELGKTGFGSFGRSHSSSETLGSPSPKVLADPVKGPPVQQEIATGFLKALKDEYVNKVDQAVGTFFKAMHVCGQDEEMLCSFEEVVKGSDGAEGATQAIAEIAEKWGMAPPS